MDVAILDRQGRRFDFDSVMIEPLSSVNLDLRSILPRSLSQTGGLISLTYTGRSTGGIRAKVTLTDRSDRVSFTVPAMNNRLEFGSTQLAALGFLPTQKAQIGLFLSNLSDEDHQVSLRISFERGPPMKRVVRLRKRESHAAEQPSPSQVSCSLSGAPEPSC